MKIYVASSWRNEYYPDTVKTLREAGHDVYDFRNPPGGGNGFHWSDVADDWRSAHTEAGWFAGNGKPVFLYIPERQEPELMYKLFQSVCCSIDELLANIRKWEEERHP